MLKLLKSFFVVIACILLVSCAGVDFSTWHFPYMMNVQQGNYITAEQLKQIKIGMNKEQVAYVLESKPVSQYMFDTNIWQYIYQDYSNNRLKKSYTITLTFDTSGKLASIKQDGEVFSQ